MRWYTGCPKKNSLKLIFEYLSLGWMFLGVIFYEKAFFFYEIFLVSKQNLEKMALISWNIATNNASKWFFKFQNEVKYLKMSLKSIILLTFIIRNWYYDFLKHLTLLGNWINHTEVIFLTIFHQIGAIFSKFCLDTKNFYETKKLLSMIIFVSKVKM